VRKTAGKEKVFCDSFFRKKGDPTKGGKLPEKGGKPIVKKRTTEKNKGERFAEEFTKKDGRGKEKKERNQPKGKKRGYSRMEIRTGDCAKNRNGKETKFLKRKRGIKGGGAKRSKKKKKRGGGACPRNKKPGQEKKREGIP